MPNRSTPATAWRGRAARPWCLLLLLCLPVFAAPVAAQELPPPEAPKTRPKPKPKGTAAPAQQQQSPGQAPAAPPSLLLSTDIGCTVTIDGDQQYKLQARAPRKVNVSIGQHLLSAVSDDGRLKWDGIVETKGAGQQVVVQISLANAAGTSPEDFDRAAAKVWLAVSDLKVAGAFAGSILNKAWGFHDKNLSTAVFTAHEFLKREVEEFKKYTPGDPDRKRFFEDMTRVATTADKYVDLLTKSISAAQSANSWMGEPNNMYAQAKALEPTMSLPAESLNTLRQSQAFKEALPVDRQVRAGLSKDPRDFNLGADYFQSTPRMLAVVDKDGLAEDLGFKAGDQLVSAGGRPIASVWDLKVAMRENPGRKMQVVYERGGKREEKEIKVPSAFPH